MKTFFFTLASALISFASFANGNKTNTCIQIPATSSATKGAVQANVFALNEQKVAIVVVQDQTQDMKIEVRDSGNHLLFSKQVTEGSFRQNLNLQQLDKGNYTILLQTETQCFVKELDVR